LLFFLYSISEHGFGDKGSMKFVDVKDLFANLNYPGSEIEYKKNNKS
jgi:hypothetical protein